MSPREKLSYNVPLKVTDKMGLDLEIEAGRKGTERPELVRMYITAGLARDAASRQGEVTAEEVAAIATSKRHGLDPVLTLSRAIEAKLEDDAGRNGHPPDPGS